MQLLSFYSQSEFMSVFMEVGYENITKATYYWLQKMDAYFFNIKVYFPFLMITLGNLLNLSQIQT